MIHHNMPDALGGEYIHLLRRLELHLQGDSIKRWGFFAGSGVASRLNDVVSDFLKFKYGIVLDHETVLLSEKCGLKQDHLKIQHPNVQPFPVAMGQ